MAKQDVWGEPACRLCGCGRMGAPTLLLTPSPLHEASPFSLCMGVSHWGPVALLPNICSVATPLAITTVGPICVSQNTESQINVF